MKAKSETSGQFEDFGPVIIKHLNRKKLDKHCPLHLIQINNNAKTPRVNMIFDDRHIQTVLDKTYRSSSGFVLCVTQIIVRRHKVGAITDHSQPTQQ